MRDKPERCQNSEKQAIKKSDNNIDTFDNLKTTNESEKIGTFDSIAKEKSGDDSIKTFDDIKKANAISNKLRKTEATEKSVENTPASLEQKRINWTSEEIKKIDWMKREEWKTLKSNVDKRIALENCGKVMRDAYKAPDPPLFSKKAEANELGSYGDGYSYDRKSGRVVGSDYRISINEEGIDLEKKVFGDDPRIALETHAHEFRHSYQCEQAHAFDKGFSVDDPIKAKEWSENLRDYKKPPDDELATTDPEKYLKEYEAYRNQPCEQDAHEFAARLVSRIYGKKEVLKGNENDY